MCGGIWAVERCGRLGVLLRGGRRQGSPRRRSLCLGSRLAALNAFWEQCARAIGRYLKGASARHNSGRGLGLARINGVSCHNICLSRGRRALLSCRAVCGLGRPRPGRDAPYFGAPACTRAARIILHSYTRAYVRHMRHALAHEPPATHRSRAPISPHLAVRRRGATHGGWRG